MPITPKCDEDALINAQKSYRADAEEKFRRPSLIEEDSTFASSFSAFSTLSKGLSQSLKKLELENTSGGKWDLSGICEGFESLESLTLSYMPEGTKMKKNWKGKSLKELEIRCCKDIGFEAFMTTKENKENKEIEEPKIKSVIIVNRKSNSWNTFMDWIRGPGLFELQSLFIDGGIFKESDLTEISRLCTSLKILKIVDCIIIDNNNSEASSIPKFKIEEFCKNLPLLELLEVPENGINENEKEEFFHLLRPKIEFSYASL